jgi:hypothetical protein
VFVVVDNGSAHRGQRSVDRLRGAWKNLILVHTSWLNQAEIYFSVTQRKVLQPNTFTDPDELERTLLAFGRHYEQIAQPFNWNFTRADLQQLLPASTSARRYSSPPDSSTNLRRRPLRHTRRRDRSGPIRGGRPLRRNGGLREARSAAKVLGGPV